MGTKRFNSIRESLSEKGPPEIFVAHFVSHFLDFGRFSMESIDEVRDKVCDEGQELRFSDIL